MLFRLATFALLTLVAGCGFHLQGAFTTPAEMERTYIAPADRHSIFYHKLRAAMKAAGVQVVDNASDATATFSILIDETDRRVLSVSARNVPREFEVYYAVVYRVQTPERTLMPSREQVLTRDYTWDETLVLGKEKEEALLREAIADDLVRVVMMQLSGI